LYVYGLIYLSQCQYVGLIPYRPVHRTAARVPSTWLAGHGAGKGH
jgi:hypothetical protein